MKTINIQNSTDYKDSIFKLFINGEKFVTQKFSYKFQVPDDKPFKIRVKYFWDGSPEYAFEPKDNMLLQVIVNQRLMNRFQFLISATMTFALATMLISKYSSSSFIFFGYFPLLFVMPFHFIARRKKYFIIKEVNNEIEDEND